MHKIKIKSEGIKGKPGSSYTAIYIDDKELSMVMGVEIKIRGDSHHYVSIELAVDDLDIDIPIEELQLKTKKERYELIDIEKE